MTFPWAKIAAVVGAIAVLAGIGWFIYSLGLTAGFDKSEKLRSEAELERVRAYQAEIEKRDKELADVQAYAANLASLVAHRDAELESTKRELKDEIKKRTTGRTCFSADLVGLLNGTDRPRLPSAQGDPSGQPPAGAVSEDVATDTDLANWAAEVMALYAQVATRLEAWQTLYKENALCR